MTFGPPLVMVGLGGMTLVLSGMALWRVIDPLTRADGDAGAAARAGRSAARELEREKQAVLKAIKEIELDYQMRKIADGRLPRDDRALPRRGRCGSSARSRRATTSASSSSASSRTGWRATLASPEAARRGGGRRAPPPQATRAAAARPARPAAAAAHQRRRRTVLQEMRREARDRSAAALVALLDAASRRPRPRGSLGRAADDGGARGGGGMPDLRVINGRPLPDRGHGRRHGHRAGRAQDAGQRRRRRRGHAPSSRTRAATSRSAPPRPTPAAARIFEGGRRRQRVPGRGHGRRREAEDRARSPMPAEGGVRTMLIAGLGAAPARRRERPARAATAAAQGRRRAAAARLRAGGHRRHGRRRPRRCPTKTLEVRAVDENGRPLADHDGACWASRRRARGQASRSCTATTDADGRRALRRPAHRRERRLRRGHRLPRHAPRHASRSPCPTAAACAPRSARWRAPPTRRSSRIGARRAHHPADARGRRCRSWRCCRSRTGPTSCSIPGRARVEIPLPKGFVNAEARRGRPQDGGPPELRHRRARRRHPQRRSRRRRQGRRQRGRRSASSLPYHGATREFAQLMPNGLGPTTLITEQVADLTRRGARHRRARVARAQRAQVLGDAGSRRSRPGGKLSFTVTGLPSTDNTGRIAAGGAGAAADRRPAVVFGRRPAAASARPPRPTSATACWSGARRCSPSWWPPSASGARQARPATPPPRTGATQLVAKLEGVYRELAALDEPRAP